MKSLSDVTKNLTATTHGLTKVKILSATPIKGDGFTKQLMPAINESNSVAKMMEKSGNI